MMIDFFPRRFWFRKSAVPPAQGDKGSESIAALLCITIRRAIARGRWAKTRASKSIRERAERRESENKFFSVEPLDLDLSSHSLFPLSPNTKNKNRPSGGASASSSRAAGSTTPSTGRSRT